MSFNAGSINATLDLDRNPFQAGMRAARAEGSNFTKERYTATAQVKIVDGFFKTFRTQLENFAKKTYTAAVRVTIQDANFKALQAQVVVFSRTKYEATVGVNVNNAQFNAFKRQLDDFAKNSRSATAKVDVSRATFDKLVADLREFGRSVYIATARVNVDDAELSAIVARLRAFGSSSTNHNVNVNTFSARAGMRALIALGPLLLPALGTGVVAVTALLGTFTSALGLAGFAAGAFGIVAGGMIKDITDFSKAQEAAEKTTSTTGKAISAAYKQVEAAVRNVAETAISNNRSIADAERNLERTIDSAAEARARAARQVVAAQSSVDSANRNLTRSQEALNRAVADSVEEYEDLQLSLRGAVLSQEQAVLDLAKAQEELAAARAEGITGNDMKQLELDVRKAELAIDETNESYGDLKAESDDFAKSGVEGSRRVRDAQQDVDDATRNVSTAEGELAEARAEAGRVGIQANQDVEDAERNLREVKDDAARASADATRQILEANAAVATAQAEAAAATADQTKALSAGAQLAYDAYQRLKTTYAELRAETDMPVGRALAAAIDAANTALGTMAPLVEAGAAGFKNISKLSQEYFESPHWRNFIDFASREAAPTMTSLFEIMAYMVRGVMNLIVAFEPLSDRVLPAIVQGLKDFGVWTEGLANDPKFKDFLDQAAISLDIFWKFLVSIVEFLFKMSVALAPTGDIILTFLTKVFDGLSKLPPEWLGAIGIAIASIFAAMALGAGGPVALGIGAISAFAFVLGDFYNKNEAAKTAVDNFVGSIRDGLEPFMRRIGDAWEQKVKPAWDGMVSAVKDNVLPVLEDLWKKFQEKILPVLGDVAAIFVEKLIPSFLEFIEAITPGVAWLISVFGTELIELFEALGRIFAGVFEGISGTFKVITGIITGDWDLFWTGMEEIGNGGGTIVAAAFGMTFDEMKGKLNQFNIDANNDWSDMWGGVKIEQDGSQTVVKGAWNQFWDDLKAWGTKTNDEMNADWRIYWEEFGDTRGASAEENRIRWEEFWTGLRDWGTKTNAEMNTNWDSFWAIFGEKQLGSQEVSTQIWNSFWTGLKDWGTKTNDEMNVAWNEYWQEFGDTHGASAEDNRLRWEQFWTNLRDFGQRTNDEMNVAWNNFWNEAGRIANDGWNTLQQGAKDGAARIGAAWAAVANYFRTPINWVINAVLNDGILNGWNTVMGWIGQPQLNAGRIPELQVFQNPIKFADGGPVQGGVANKDSVPILAMAGEYVLSKKMVEGFGGISAVHQLAQTAGSSTGVDGMQRIAHYAKGGPVEQGAGPAPAGNAQGNPVYQQLARVVQAALPGTRLTSGYRPGDNGYHGRGMAADLAGPRANDASFMSRINQWIAGAYPNSTELIYTPGINLRNGAPHNYSPAVKADHYDHVHWAMANGLGGGAAGGGDGGGFIAGIVEQVVSWWSQLGNKVTGLFRGMIPGSIPGLGGVVGDAALKIPPPLIEKVIGAAQTKLSNLFTTIMGGGGGGGDMGPGSGPVVDQVRSVANAYGWGQGPQWDALSRLIQKESSWNPNAQNPTSTAYGLFQFLNSTWATVGATKTSNPGQQAQAGLKYIQGKYRDPQGALNFHNNNNWYDNGGWLMPGKSLAWNATSRPEKVMPQREYNDLLNRGSNPEDIAAIVRAVVQEVGAVGSTNIFNLKEMPNMTAEDLLEETNFKLKTTGRGGLYS